MDIWAESGVSASPTNPSLAFSETAPNPYLTLAGVETLLTYRTCLADRRGAFLCPRHGEEHLANGVGAVSGFRLMMMTTAMQPNAVSPYRWLTWY